MTMNKMLLAALALPFALVACSDAEAPEDPDVQDEAALNEDAPEPAPQPELDLSGTWSMDSWNNAGVPSVFPITMTFGDDDVLTVNSDCVTMRYQLNRQGNSITPEHLGTSKCARNLTDGEKIIEDVIPELNIVAYMGDQLVLTGTSGVMKLSRAGAA